MLYVSLGVKALARIEDVPLGFMYDKATEV